MAEEFSADTDELDAFVERAGRHLQAMAATHARLIGQRSTLTALSGLATNGAVEHSVLGSYRELAEEVAETARQAADVSASLQDDGWTDIARTAIDGSWQITSTLPNHPAFAWTLATDPGALLPRYRSTALGVGDWAAGIAHLGDSLSWAIPGSPGFVEAVGRSGHDPSGHPAARFVAGLADVGADLTSLIPGTRAFADEVEEVTETRSPADHAGLAAAMGLAASTLDWETFQRDPNRWFGRVAPDIVLDAATAGWGGRGSRVDDVARGLDDAVELAEAARGLDDVTARAARQVEIVDSKPWRTFDRHLDNPFLDVLDDFGGDPSPPLGLRGGEGQLFLSDQHPTRALKRWHRSRLDQFDQSVDALVDARQAVQSEPDVAAVLDVVEVHDRGPDWILRDYDPKSEPLSEALRSGRPEAEQALGEVIETLRGTTNPSLRTILERLDRPRPSANVHWSGKTNRLLIIDMM